MLRQLAMLLGFSLNVSTNESDGNYLRRYLRQGDGAKPEIIYVFDHTALEMYLALDDSTRKYSAAFHLSEWRRTSRRSGKAELEQIWTSINRQTAIITSEYLFAGKLPGQEDGQFYMTAGHYEEFCNAVDRRQREASGKIDNLARMAQRIIADSKQDYTHVEEDDSYLYEDLSSLFGADHLTSEAAEEFRRTRRIAARLSAEEELFRLQQIKRATSRSFIDRIVPLDLRFPLDRLHFVPPLDGWHQTLIQTENNRSNLRKSDKGRGDHNMRRDEEAVAYAQWIARSQLFPHQRIVFVTGDPLILTAYDKWHKERIVRDPAEPRVVRDIQQFAPILNMDDMRIGLDNSWKIFDMLREAVEAPLLAFNLSSLSRTPRGNARSSDDENEKIRYASRRDLVLRLSGEGPMETIRLVFGDRLTPEWYKNNERIFTMIAQALRQFERLAIGLNSRFVEQRIEVFLKDYERWSIDTGLGEHPQQFLEDLLERTARQSVDLWFPVALQALAEGERSSHSTGRTPNLIQLRVGELDDESSPRLVAVVDEWLDSKTVPEALSNPDFRSRRHLVFSAASIASMRMGRWAKAHRYSELAISAAKFQSEDGKSQSTPMPVVEDESYFQELLYLRALTCRLRIGSRGPVDLLGNDIWASWLDQGLDDLERCLRHHSALGEWRACLRAKSEMIALRGFYASWWPILTGTTSTSALLERSPQGYSPARAEAEFARLVSSLAEALTLLESAPAPDVEDGKEYPHIQLRANVAAAYALTQIPGGFPEQIFLEGIEASVIIANADWWQERLAEDRVEIELKPLPTLVRIQLAIFLKAFAPRFSIDPHLLYSSTAPVLRLDEKLGSILHKLLASTLSPP